MLKQSITWQKEDETVNIYILQGAYRRLVSICFFKAFTLSSLNFRILLFLSTIPLESSFFCLSLTSIQKIFWFDQAKFLVHFRYNIDQMVLSLINISNWVIYDELYHKWIEKYVLFCCNEFWMKTFEKRVIILQSFDPRKTDFEFFGFISGSSLITNISKRSTYIRQRTRIIKLYWNLVKVLVIKKQV